MKKLKKIVHIATDEKFINSVYWQFEKAFPKQNTFYILVKDATASLRHVQVQKGIIVYPNRIAKLKELAKLIEPEAIVFFHPLFYPSNIIANRLSSENKIIWGVFGFEFYTNHIYPEKLLYGIKTFNQFIKPKYPIFKKIKNKVKKSINKVQGLIYQIDSPEKETENAIKRTNFLAISAEEEFDNMKSFLPFSEDLTMFKFFYYPIELMVENIETLVGGANILLGNSSTPTNNHVEAFDLIEDINIGNRKIICPLSYGDKVYADMIIRNGKNRFGDNFIPLVDFMPLHEYNSFISKCGIVIMNHYRQQATGNILTMIWLGAKVFLNENSTTYSFLKRIGIKVFSVSKDLGKENSLSLLNQMDVSKNREILKSKISQETLVEEIRRFINKI